MLTLGLSGVYCCNLKDVKDLNWLNNKAVYCLRTVTIPEPGSVALPSEYQGFVAVFVQFLVFICLLAVISLPSLLIGLWEATGQKLLFFLKDFSFSLCPQ